MCLRSGIRLDGNCPSDSNTDSDFDCVDAAGGEPQKKGFGAAVSGFIKNTLRVSKGKGKRRKFSATEGERNAHVHVHVHV